MDWVFFLSFTFYLIFDLQENGVHHESHVPPEVWRTHYNGNGVLEVQCFCTRPISAADRLVTCVSNGVAARLHPLDDILHHCVELECVRWSQRTWRALCQAGFRCPCVGMDVQLHDVLLVAICGLASWNAQIMNSHPWEDWSDWLAYQNVCKLCKAPKSTSLAPRGHAVVHQQVSYDPPYQFLSPRRQVSMHQTFLHHGG